MMDIVILILVSALHTYPATTISTNHVRAISSRDYYRNGPLPPDKVNWEIGLKEATYQALIREQVTDPALKTGIYSANIEGFQDAATPFGDIAVIARGQLYATGHGYQFLQDPYQNDCEDCHNTPHRCDRRQCETVNNQNLDHLLALWTVKRIRHRDPKSGHRYELQFTISPMSPAANAQFVARHGRFDYSVPGHVFIVRLKDGQVQHSRNNFRFDKEHRGSNNKEFKILPWPHDHINNADAYNHDVRTTQTQQHHYHQHNTPNSILLNTGEYYLSPKDKSTATTTEQHVFNPGFLIGISPNGYKHIIHDIPGLVGERPYTEDRQYNRPQDVPSRKEPIKHYHHHFYIPEVEDIDLYDRKVPNHVIPATTLTTTTNNQQFFTNYKPTVTTTNGDTTQYNYGVSPPQNTFTQETTQAQVSPPLTTTDQRFKFPTTYRYPETTVPITINPTIFHTHTEPNPRTTLVKVYTVPDTTPTQSTPFSPSPFYIHYSEPDPIYNSQPPPTVPSYITQTVHPTVPSYVTIQDEMDNHPRTATIVDLYEEIGYTQATTPTPITATSTKQMNYPDSINAQLPPPDKGTDTTVPYVASTAVTIISTQSPSTVTETTVQEKASSENHHYEKDTESTNRKATTIQEITTLEDTTQTTVKITGRTKQRTTPYEETTTPTIIYTEDEIIPTSTEATTSHREQNQDVSSELFDTVHIPKKITKPKVVYSEDFEIFGNTKKSTERSTDATKATKQQPNAFDEIFSDFKVSTENTNRFFKSSTENSNRFLTPHTQLAINNTDALKNARISKYLKFKRNKSNRLSKFSASRNTEKQNKTEPLITTDKIEENLNDNVETKTSQSFITSISFKVNKNKNKQEPSESERLTKGEMYEMNTNNNTESNTFKVKMVPNYPQTTTDKSQTFNDVAQTLVNHAKVVTYLNSKSTKPTKRTYTPTLR